MLPTQLNAILANLCKLQTFFCLLAHFYGQSIVEHCFTDKPTQYACMTFILFGGPMSISAHKVLHFAAVQLGSFFRFQKKSANFCRLRESNLLQCSHMTTGNLYGEQISYLPSLLGEKRNKRINQWIEEFHYNST